MGKIRNINRKFQSIQVKKQNTLNAPIVTVIGVREIFLENYKNIMEYSEELIKINTSVGLLKIQGVDLWIKKMNNESLTIYGDIGQISYENVVK